MKEWIDIKERSLPRDRRVKIRLTQSVCRHSDKEERSDVDERENARYGSSVRSEEIIEDYDLMKNVCLRCISQCEEIVFSEKQFEVPKELLEY